jgi:K+-sensing histidine kinase KdpD
MKVKSKSIIILGVLLGYILLQFLWWEILLVKQTSEIIDLKQKIAALSTTNQNRIVSDILFLQQKKNMQVVMIVGEGTVFLLLLLFGIYKIKQTQDKENALNNQQKNFLLSITHELKTPIASTKLQLQTLQKQKLDEITQQNLISDALTETERLNTLIDNVLLASRLDSGEFKFNLESHNLSELILATLNRYYKNELLSKIINHKISNNIICNIDQNAFPSIITNLIDNAIKYSPNQKQVWIELEKQKNTIVLRVKDCGIGISNKDKEKIFTKFFRAGNEDTRNTKGTGLGLFIVNYIVKKHQGSIKVKDNLPTGSVFEIYLNEI